MSLPSDIANSIKNQAAKVLATGQRFTRFNQIRQRHFWSTYRFTPNVNGFINSGDFEIFQTPAGQRGQGFDRQLTLLETNWPSSNRVPDNQNFELTELGVTSWMVLKEVDPGPQPFGVNQSGWQWQNYAAANQHLLDNTILSITYLTNQVPLGMCNDFAQSSAPHVGWYAPGAPSVYPLDDAYAALPDWPIRENFVSNGFASPGLRRRFKIPVLLQHGETFKFTLSISPGRGPFMWPYLPTVAPGDFENMAFDVRVDFWATESFVEAS